MNKASNAKFYELVAAITVRQSTVECFTYPLPKVSFTDVEEFSKTTFLTTYKSLLELVGTVAECQKVTISSPTKSVDLDSSSVITHMQDAFNRALTYWLTLSCQSVYDKWAYVSPEFEKLCGTDPEKFATIRQEVTNITELCAQAYMSADSINCFIENEFQTQAWDAITYQQHLDTMVGLLDQIFENDRLPKLLNELNN